MNWPGIAVAVVALLALLAWDTVCYAWVHERQKRGRKRQMRSSLALRRRIVRLERRFDVLTNDLGVEIPEPAEDDSPAAEESVNLNADTEVQALDAEPEPGDCPTDEIPIAPATVPDGIPLAVQSALIEQRPSPVPRKSADWVEEEIAAMRARNAERMARAEGVS